MDPTNNKASDFERRASRRVSARLSLSAGDHRFAEEEENDAVLGLGIADGFRPVSIDRHQTPTPERASTSSGSSGSGSGEPSTPPRSLTSIRPSSIAKPPQHQDPFALRHDGGMGQVQETPLSRHSSTTTSTDATIVREESPYEGPSGPSFPYQMYPQNVRVARTLSVTTASTAVQSESSYQGPRGPSHPYGIYHQNTITPPSAPPPTNIPVGFPGMRDNYQRRLGPDGEDAADLIGPDGHTEQLPPYTRYPDEAYTRKAGAAADVPPAPATVLPIPGAGGIGLAARNPEFDELDTPRSRLSSRSFTSDISHHEINTAADVVNEKRSSRRSYQQYAKRRIGGIVPCWAVCLVVSGLVLMGIILGAVVGSFLVKHNNNNTVNRPPPPARLTPNPVVTSVTITVDATPIPTPSDIPPLPLGTYVLPLITNKTPNSCFKDPSQSQAWSCNIALPFSSPLTITIDPSPPSSNSQYIMSISANESNLISNGLLPYGTQPPLIRERVHLELVNDTMEPSRGPAWFELIHYNKTVVMKESFLGPLASSTSPSSSAATAHSERRRFKTPSFEDFHRKSVAQPGEKPWVCTWPDTVLEVFIFPNQNTSLSRLDLGSSSSTTSTTAPGGYPTAKPDGYYSAKGFPAPGAAPTPTTPADAAVTTPPSPPAPPYPRFVKVEERHMDYAPQAECVQFEVPADGSRPRPYKNPATGKIVKIEIEDTYERHDIALHRLAPGAISNNLVGRDSVQLSDCGCLWYVT